MFKEFIALSTIMTINQQLALIPVS